MKATWFILKAKLRNSIYDFQLTITFRPYERPLQQLRYYSMNGTMNEYSQQVSGRDQNARDKNWFPLKGTGNFYLTRSRENSRAYYQDYSVSRIVG